MGFVAFSSRRFTLLCSNRSILFAALGVFLLIYIYYSTFPADEANELEDGIPNDNIFLVATVSVEWLELTVLFINHWKALGIRSSKMLLTVNQRFENADYDSKYQRILQALINAGIQSHQIIRWKGAFTEEAKAFYLAQNLVDHEVVTDQQYVVLADGDEFTTFGDRSIFATVNFMHKNGIDGLRAEFVDRLSLNGSLPAIIPSSALTEQFPLYCEITQSVIGAVAWKIVLFRANYRPSPHDLKNKAEFYEILLRSKQLLPSNRDLRELTVNIPSSFGRRRKCCECAVHHFKWTDQVLMWQKIRAESHNYHLYPKEAENFLNAIQSNNGRLPVDSCYHNFADYQRGRRCWIYDALRL